LASICCTTTLLFWSAEVVVDVCGQPTVIVGVDGLAAGSASSTVGHSADGCVLAGSVGVATACIPSHCDHVFAFVTQIPSEHKQHNVIINLSLFSTSNNL